MKTTRKGLLYLALLLLTAAYGAFVSLAMGLFSQALTRQHLTALSNLTRLTATRPRLWQALAVASLALNYLAARRAETKDSAGGNGHLYAAVMHIAWLLFCLFWHAAGMLLPFVVESPVIE